MRLLFISIPIYQVALGQQQAYWQRIRRLGADKIFESITGFRPPANKISLCRGLWLLASAAKRVGHDIRWIDVEPGRPCISETDLIWAEQLWLYAMTPTFLLCTDIASQAKHANPDILVFVGGPHTRYLHEEVLLGIPQIDFAEATPASATELVAHVENPTAMPGISYLEGGRVSINASAIPAVYSEYIDPSVLPQPLSSYYINTSSSRGCCRKCAFCLEGQVPLRFRDFDEVIQELDLLNEQMGPEGVVHLFDTSLWAAPKRCIELAKFITKNIGIQHFSCDLEARTPHDTVLHTLAAARMQTVAIGFESCRNEVLNFVGKNGTFEERVAIARHVRKFMPSSTIKAYWLMGLPGSTENTLRDELNGIRHVLEEGIADQVSAKLFVPYPGTPFFNNPEAYGLTLTRDYKRFDRFSIPPVCYPTAVGRDNLSEILLRCEQLIAECYTRRLGTTHERLALSDEEPRRYNGQLYISEKKGKQNNK